MKFRNVRRCLARLFNSEIEAKRRRAKRETYSEWVSRHSQKMTDLEALAKST